MNIEAKDVRPGDHVKAVYDKGEGVTITYEGPIEGVEYGVVRLANGLLLDTNGSAVTVTRPKPVLPTEIGAIITNVRTGPHVIWERGVCIHPGVFALFDLSDPDAAVSYSSDEIVSWE